jgi:diaminopimelate decarboxylase
VLIAEARGSRGIDAVGPDLAAATERFGTPLYVIDAAVVAQSASRMERAFPDPWIRQYSLKANDLPAVVRTLTARGWGANVVSSGEWQRATEAGVPHGLVSFEGIGKTDADLERVVRSSAQGDPLRWLSVESAEEADTLAAFASQARLGDGDRAPVDVLLRLNPQVDPETRREFAVGAGSSKFGMTAAEIAEVVAAHGNRAGVRIRGIHLHVGSNLSDVVAWSTAGSQAVRLLGTLSERLPSADTVDFGGGFPVGGSGLPGPDSFRDALVRELEAAGLQLPPVTAIEPGRYLVSTAGWLVSRVLHGRSRAAQRQVVLDAGMTELIRPALYGSHHPIHPVRVAGVADQAVSTAVEGPICESTDSFGTHELPLLRRGDLVAFGNVGAYGASFTSRYNGRPEPVEVIIAADGTLQRCDREPLRRPTTGPEPVQRLDWSGHAEVVR